MKGIQKTGREKHAPFLYFLIGGLYLMALEPVAETTADTRSYGFRKERRCMDAVTQCHNILRKGYSPEWILEGDIKGCFDHISHEWLLANIPMDKAML